MTDKPPIRGQHETGEDDLNPFGKWLNRKLSGIFGGLAQEPLPQNILDLARKVDAAEPSPASPPLANPGHNVKHDS